MEVVAKYQNITFHEGCKCHDRSGGGFWKQTIVLAYTNSLYNRWVAIAEWMEWLLWAQPGKGCRMRCWFPNKAKLKFLPGRLPGTDWWLWKWNRKLYYRETFIKMELCLCIGYQVGMLLFGPSRWHCAACNGALQGFSMQSQCFKWNQFPRLPVFLSTIKLLFSTSAEGFLRLSCKFRCQNSVYLFHHKFIFNVWF